MGEQKFVYVDVDYLKELEETAKKVDYYKGIIDGINMVADRKTEPQRGCDADCNEDCAECAKETELWKAEQTEPKPCETCRHWQIRKDIYDLDDAYCELFYDNAPCKYEPKDEPQTDCYVSDLCKHYGDKQICGRCRNRNLFAEADTESKSKTKPQTEYDKGLQLFTNILFDKEKSEQFLKECKAIGIEP